MGSGDETGDMGSDKLRCRVLCAAGDMGSGNAVVWRVTERLLENQHAEGKRMKRKKGRGEEMGSKNS